MEKDIHLQPHHSSVLSVVHFLVPILTKRRHTSRMATPAVASHICSACKTSFFAPEQLADHLRRRCLQRHRRTLNISRGPTTDRPPHEKRLKLSSTGLYLPISLKLKTRNHDEHQPEKRKVMKLASLNCTCHCSPPFPSVVGPPRSRRSTKYLVQYLRDPSYYRSSAGRQSTRPIFPYNPLRDHPLSFNGGSYV